jgi:hypothetical protein
MRAAAFYLLLCIPIVVWAAVVIPNYLSFLDSVNYSAAIVAAAVAVSPVVGGDISVFGEVTPVILAGSIIALMPAQAQNVNYAAIGLALCSYLLFVHLSVYFTSGQGVGLLEFTFPSIAEPQKIVLSLIANVRVMAIVICAAILGFKVKAG